MQQAQTLHLHEWISYFIDVILQAQDDTKEQILFTIKKAHFFGSFKSELNERQLKVIRKMTDQGTEGFEGGMTAKKYISITKVSKATATRDLQALAELNIFLPSGVVEEV
ncbi:MAG: hypothetical protein AAF363_15925 [Bacteroidota bacterium]